MAEISIKDRTAELRPNNYRAGRSGGKVELVVLHDTTGTTKEPHLNNEPADWCERLAQGTANYLLTGNNGGGPSCHYQIGPEKSGAWVQRLCREDDTAWHAAGFPIQNVFVTESGNRLDGYTSSGDTEVNAYSIGIERFGSAGERAEDLPKQKAVMVALCLDIARRRNLKSWQFVTHDWLQVNRNDGNIFLADVRKAVDDMWAGNGGSGGGLQPGERELNGFTMRGEILARWSIFKDDNLSLATFGLPLSEEYEVKEDGTTRQDFEKTTLVFNGALTGAWRVQGAHVKR